MKFAAAWRVRCDRNRDQVEETARRMGEGLARDSYLKANYPNTKFSVARCRNKFNLIKNRSERDREIVMSGETFHDLGGKDGPFGIDERDYELDTVKIPPPWIDIVREAGEQLLLEE